MLATVMRVRILVTVWLQWSRSERLATVRCRSWHELQNWATSSLPSPSGSSLGSFEVLTTSASGMRYERADHRPSGRVVDHPCHGAIVLRRRNRERGDQHGSRRCG